MRGGRPRAEYAGHVRPIPVAGGDARDRGGRGRKRERNEERKRNQRVTVREKQEGGEAARRGQAGSGRGASREEEGEAGLRPAGWLAGSRSVGRKGVKRRNNSRLSCRAPGAAEPRPDREIPSIS